jgi:hypothetical protein
MGKKLSVSNRYLRDPEVRQEGLWVSAKTSSAVEGIREPFSERDAKTGRFISVTPDRKRSRGASRSGGSPS